MKYLLPAVVSIFFLSSSGAPLWEIDQPVTAEPFTTKAFSFSTDPRIRPIRIAGPEYRGKATWIFAWYGLPAERKGKVPGVVLIHGGGGTAYHRWVKLWVDHGYAAIAVSTSGNWPSAQGEGDEPPKEKRTELRFNPDGGPGENAHAEVQRPVRDQWFFHAVNAVILANGFLHSQPEVDAKKIGVTGISWGGFLTCVAAGIDPRFAFAVPVYGCGFLGDEGGFGPLLKKMRENRPGGDEFYRETFDPANFIGNARMPMLFVNGTNDRFYRLDEWSRTVAAAPNANCTLLVKYAHSHSAGMHPPEIMVFADSVVGNAPPLAKVGPVSAAAGRFRASFTAETELKTAVLAYTRESGNSWKREWQTVPVEIDRKKRELSAAIPKGARSCFFSITDQRELRTASPVFDIVP